MNHEESLEITRDGMLRYLRMSGHKSNPIEDQNISRSLQNIIKQIPDRVIFSGVENPQQTLRIQILKPKPDENSNHGSHKS